MLKVIYSKQTKDTGERLKKIIESNIPSLSEEDCIIINYGANVNLDRFPMVLNRDITNSSNKIRMNLRFRDYGVPSPPIIVGPKGFIAPFDGFVRKRKHKGGQNMVFFPEGAEVYLTENEYFVKKENIANEYRAFVIGGRVWEINKKEKITDPTTVTEDDYTEVIYEETAENEARNFENGWIFKLVDLDDNIKKKIEEVAISAAESVGVDFCAVDIIETTNGQILALETNAGASLKIPRKVFAFTINILKYCMEKFGCYFPPRVHEA